MSYSRWGGRGSGHWYTYWVARIDEENEDRDAAMFCICCVASFSAKELRDAMDLCMAQVHEIDPKGDVAELRQYAMEFLEDIDNEYPGA